MANKQLWTTIKSKFQGVLRFLRKINPFTKQRLGSAMAFMGRMCKAVLSYLKRSWKSIAVVVPVFLFVYYTFGGYVTHTINKDISIEIKTDNGFDFVETGAFLIKREVDDNMWTPNLPFIFPGFVLDNMPAFQTGVLHSVKIAVKALSSTYDVKGLKEAHELLKYPPNVWILSKGEDLALAPSSGAQYRKARKELVEFNKNANTAASDDKKVLIALLGAVEKDLNKIVSSVENQVREFSPDWVDFSADEMFYLSQGKIYGHYVLLQAASRDFKHLIVDSKQYEKMTSLFKALEDAIVLDPLIVRNSEVESVVAANHLMALNYYISKARYILNQIKDNVMRD